MGMASTRRTMRGTRGWGVRRRRAFAQLGGVDVAGGEEDEGFAFGFVGDAGDGDDALVFGKFEDFGDLRFDDFVRDHLAADLGEA